MLLLASLVFGMWWLSLFQYSMKWDIMDITLPWNHFISECLRAGDLPLWNPFLKNGFPVMGLPDTWYPITWIISLVFGMDVWSIQLDYLLHLFIGGYGMYTYSKSRNIDANYSIALGVCYMFSGFMVGNAQHLGWVIGAAWVPWIYYLFEKLISTQSKGDLLKLSLVASLLFYGSYPPITIILFYILFLKFVILVIKNSEVRSRKLFLVFGLSFLLFAMISAVGLVGLTDLSPHLDRGGRLPLSNAGWGVLTGFLPIKAMSSFVIPYAGTAVDGSWGSDISLINCYCGLIVMLIMIGGLWIRNKPTLKYFVVGVVFLMIAMSEVFPFRSWLYYLPLFDKFRFPSLFRLFAIFYLLLASGYAYESLKDTIGAEKIFKYVKGTALVVIVGSFLWIYFQADLDVVSVLLNEGLNGFNKTAGFYDKALVDLFLYLLLIGVLLLCNVLGRSGFRQIPYFIILEVLLISQFNISETVVHFGDPSIGNDEIHNYQGQEISIDLTKPMTTFEDGYWKENLTWFRFNQASITKTPSAGGNSPFSLINTKAAKRNGDISINRHPLFFLADIIDQKVVESSTDDDSHEHLKVITSDNTKFVIQTNYTKETDLVFLQNNYLGWKAKVDGIATDIETLNTTFMSVPIKGGTHEVEFYFNARKMVIAFWISLCFFVLTLAAILFYTFKIDKS